MADVPDDFQWKEFDLDDLSNWKATQFSFFLYYFSAVYLRKILQKLPEVKHPLRKRISKKLELQVELYKNASQNRDDCNVKKKNCLRTRLLTQLR